MSFAVGDIAIFARMPDIPADTLRVAGNSEGLRLLLGNTLLGFMVAEQGRRADKRLAESLPLVLYFVSDVERDAFVELVREAKPNMITKKVP